MYGGWLSPRLKQEQKFRCKILCIGGNAYLQDEYPVADSTVKELISRILVAFGSGSSNKAFGSSQEFSGEDLREYYYMFSMPYFEDQVELAVFESHNQALETIETILRNSKNCIKRHSIRARGLRKFDKQHCQPVIVY